VTCIECGKPIEGCVEMCGMCFAAMMEREFHLFAGQKHAPYVYRIPEHQRPHVFEPEKVEAAVMAERHERLVAEWGEVAAARIEGTK
jgi:hypothetical protein